MRFFFGLGLLSVVVFGVGCKPNRTATGEPQQSSSEITTRKSEQRPIVGFNQITIKSGIEVHMMSQAQCTFSVSAPVDVLPFVKTSIDYGNLSVWVDAKDMKLIRPVQVFLSSVDLIAVNLSEAATADISSVKEKTFKVNLSGGSTLKVKGKARLLDAVIDGASKLDAGELVAQDVKLGAKGASKALVNTAGKFDVDADGASMITYKGSPKVKAIENGASTVTPANKSAG